MTTVVGVTATALLGVRVIAPAANATPGKRLTAMTADKPVATRARRLWPNERTFI
jgi:hypothetical protein